MDNCKLCKNKPADKKGSHIVPHFLLKRIENEEGKSERDYEIGFSIGQVLFPIQMDFAWKLNYRGDNNFRIGIICFVCNSFWINVWRGTCQAEIAVTKKRDADH